MKKNKPIQFVFLTFSLLLYLFSLQASENNTIDISKEEKEKLLANIWVNYDVGDLTESQMNNYYQIISSLRCPVCQGQSLTESNADLAIDLKSMVYEKLAEGKTAEQIKDLLVDRYGDFIYFRPPINKSTFALWYLPALIILIGIIYLIYRNQKLKPPENWK